MKPTAHRRRFSVPGLGLIALLAILHPAAASADSADWPGFRGPLSSTDGALPETFGLSVAWSQDIGPGYSSLAVADGKVIAAYTDGDDDVLAAFDTESGERIWRLRLADKYVGHDGSTDGPLATPTIAGDQVFMLGAKGQIVAANLKTGKEQWRVLLDESNSTEPFYGYTTSPLVVEDTVMVMTGGASGTITAYDAKTGAKRWSRGEDLVQYQSPSWLRLAGRSQVVVPSGQWVQGIDPASGEVLWSFRYSEGETQEESVHATAAGEDRLLLNLRNDSLMLSVQATADGMQVSELWRGRPLSGSLALPIYHEGHLYGFTGRIFSSVDATTGELNWRTREVHAFNLTLLDGHLVTLIRDGALVVIEANPEAYTEVARIAALDAGDYADPAFADGRVFVRNLTQLAAIQIDAGGRPQAAEPVAEEARHVGDFGAWVRKVEALPEAERQAAVDHFVASEETTPIVEGRWAHFVYQGAEHDVGVGGTIFGWAGEEESLHRVAGTDFFYRSIELDPKGSYSYLLMVDFADGAPDPKNPRIEDRGFLTQSILHMPEWSASSMVEEPSADMPRGQVDRFQFHSTALDNARQVQVWTPPGYAGADSTHPLVVVNHGDQALRNGHFANILDQLAHADTVANPIVVFVPRLAVPEYNGDATEQYIELLADELVPHIRKHYRVSDAQGLILGVGSGGVISLHAALERPELFDRVATFSFFLTDANREAYWQRIAESSASFEKIRVETGPNDYDIAGAGIDAERSSIALAEKLEAKGWPVELVVHHGAAGWAAWRDRVEPTLVALLPAAEN